MTTLRRWPERDALAFGVASITTVVSTTGTPPHLGVVVREHAGAIVAHCCVDEPRKLGAFTDEEAAIRAVVRAAGARLRITEQRLGRRPPSGSTPAPRFRH